VLRIFPVERLRVRKDSSCLLERDTVLLLIAERLGSVPREHISVYTLIIGGRQYSESKAAGLEATALHEEKGECAGGFETRPYERNPPTCPSTTLRMKKVAATKATATPTPTATATAIPTPQRAKRDSFAPATRSV